MFLIVILTIFLNAEASFPPSFPIEEGRLDYYSIGPNENRGSEINKEAFSELIYQVYGLYKNEAEKLEREINIGIMDWDQPYFSAWALHDKDNQFTINFWGGFARLPNMTKRAFVMTICHEIGHVLGGNPYHQTEFNKLMTSEGQADYFASALCFKYYNRTFGFGLANEINPYAIDMCLEKFSEKENEFEECLQVAKAGEDLGRVLALMGNVNDPLYETPSELIVSETLFDSYPTVQCRLDTYLMGALSRFDSNSILISIEDFLRPKCWFKN